MTATTESKRGRRVRGVWAVAVAFLVLALFLAIFGAVLAPHDPIEGNLMDASLPPSSQHWLGTDESGRDIASRMLAGARSSLLGPLVVSLVGTLLGTTIALIAAWNGGWTDKAFARMLDVEFAFPGILLAILAVSTFGVDIWVVSIAVGLAAVPIVARIVRSGAVRERSLDYVAALELQGATGWRICSLHLVPNLLRLIVAQMTLLFAEAMVVLAGLSYLGLGVQEPNPDWGLMLSAGQQSMIGGRPLQLISATVAIVVFVVSVNVIGERMANEAVEAGQR